MRPAAASGARRGRPGTRGRGSRTARLVVLLGVLGVLTVLLAPALRTYLAQQAQISALEDTVRQRQATVAELQKERAAWDDPAYVRAQARERLKFVLPGEKTYTVLDPKAAAKQPKQQRVRVAGTTGTTDRAWFGDVWRSVQIAGGVPAATK